MTNTIPNVPRKLLADLLGNDHDKRIMAERHLLAMLANAPSPAGVDGLVRNFKTREGYDIWDKLCAIKKYGFLIGPSGGVVKVLDIGSWIDRDEAQSVVGEAQCEVNLLRGDLSDAQAIIDGLRGENERIRLNIAEYNEAVACYQSERDQQAQRIGELEGLLLRVRVSLSLDDTEWGYRGAEKYKLLADIRAALSACKDGE